MIMLVTASGGGMSQVGSQGAIDLEYESDGKSSAHFFLGKGLCWVSLAYFTCYVVYQLVHQTSQRNPGQHFFSKLRRAALG